MKKTISKLQAISATDEMEQKSRLLHAVNGVAEILLTTNEQRFENSLQEAMALVARCLGIDRIYIWQNKIQNDKLLYFQQFEWLSDHESWKKTVRPKECFYYAESIPEWEEKFRKGECVNGPLNSLSQNEQIRLGPYGIKSILVIPVHLQEYFWGFVSFDDCHQERTFTADEVSILRSGNLMMVNALDRHDAAVKMHEVDEHARLMQDATPLCCTLWDKEFNILDCNEEAIKLFGLKDKKELLERYTELWPKYQPDGCLSTEKAKEIIAIAFREGRTIYECMHQMPNGEPIPVEATLVRVRRGDEYIVAGYTRDLREHKKMMKAIKYKDALLRMANDVATILLQSEIDTFEDDLVRCLGMIAKSVSADRIYICKNHENDGQLHGKMLYEWPNSTKSQKKALQEVIYSEKETRWKEKLSRGQCQCINVLVRDMQSQLSSQRILSILAVPVFLQDRFWGFVGFDDCHRRRVFSKDEESTLRSCSLLIANALLRNEMTHKIHVAVEQALAASKAKSAFLAHMNHEMRTPMNVIAGMTELILRENVPITIYEHVMSVKQASANMLSLINDVLDFSKIEAGNLNIMSAQYSLASLINNLLIIIRMKISEKSVKFTANIDCNIPNWLIGDETRIRQILLNVLDNAAKYTTKGFISLTVTGEVNEDIVVLTAEISDSGVGIKEECIDKLFDDFMRFDNENNKSVQGTGLGLAITKNLCQAMGGNISVRSKYNVGSTFTITIPQKIKSHDEKFASVSDPDTKSVLLYETHHLYADSITRSFDNLNVRSTLVKSPQEFYEELNRKSYSFVFVSSMLCKSALQIIEELKIETTLVAITGFSESPAIRNARTITMPVHTASIANILNDIEDNIFNNGNGRETDHLIAPSAKILVVDDLSTNLKVAQGLMLPYQMQVDVCCSGEEAVECVQKKQYDIIFMDHMMPEMDGIEATIHIRSLKDRNGYYQRVPIIALTANAISGVREMFLQKGMNDFLAKPIDVTKLHTILEKWIPEEKKERFRGKQTSSSINIDSVSIQIDGIDIQAGITMTGGAADGYLKMLSIFLIDGANRINKIRDSLEKNDIKLYTVYVHSIKGAAASIGARKISELFRTLEMAGKREDLAFIRGNTDRILNELEVLLKNIQDVVSKNQVESGNENDPIFIKNELMKLRESLNNRDAGEIDDIMNVLETIKWDQQTADLFKELSKNILLINYIDAALLVDKLLIS